MPQAIRDSGKDLASYRDTMRKRIKLGRAITNINRAMEGEEVGMVALQTSMEVYKKEMPSYAAIAIEHRTTGPQSIHDLNAMLLSSGLDALPDSPAQVIDNVPEKVLSPVSVCEGGAPPDSDT